MVQEPRADRSLPVAGEAPAVELEDVTKRFGEFTAVDKLNLVIEENKFFALLGPSGCGKTTTLRMVGGFEDTTEGIIRLHGQDVTGRKPYHRMVNTVFQSYALFPHLTIFENVAFGLRRRKIDDADVKRRVHEMLDLVQLSGREDQKPRTLSGGQQQRVALARALINHPRVLLLDEPLGALDLKLRKEMQIELKRIQNEVGITFIHVTHDQEEAMTMADTIAVMNEGRIERMGTATEIYENPRSGFVAEFLGASNLMHADVDDASSGTVVLERGTRARVLPDRIPAGSKKVRLGVRPEKIRLVPVDTSTEGNAMVGRVVDVSFIGVSTHYLVETDEIAELAVMAQNLDDKRFAPGEKVKAVWPAGRTFIVT